MLIESGCNVLVRAGPPGVACETLRCYDKLGLHEE
jgi:hypothetical protein